MAMLILECEEVVTARKRIHHDLDQRVWGPNRKVVRVMESISDFCIKNQCHSNEKNKFTI